MPILLFLVRNNRFSRATLVPGVGTQHRALILEREIVLRSGLGFIRVPSRHDHTTLAHHLAPELFGIVLIVLINGDGDEHNIARGDGIADQRCTPERARIRGPG